MRIINNTLIFISKSYWKYTVFNIKTLESFFSCLGGLWVIVSVIHFFFPSVNPQLIKNWELFFAIIIIYVVWSRQPKTSINEKLNDRDLSIEIKIGNIFDVLSARIISTNTTFDTDITNNIISKDSLQGQFAQKYYDNINHLNSDLDRALEGIEYKELSEQRIGKKKRYPIGTTAKLRVKNETFYLLAIADLNQSGVAQTTFENIKNCLAEIWEYIEHNGNMESIAIPLLGSGRCRLPQKRNAFAKEIIKSFIAACSTKKLCDKLTIVITPADYRHHELDLYELGEYLRYQCKYTEFREGDAGTGIE